MSQMVETYKAPPGIKTPIRWLAPETVTESIFSAKTDVYTYGILCWEIMNNAIEPYPDEELSSVQRKVSLWNFVALILKHF